MKTVLVKDVIAAMELIAPAWLALDIDPIGLHTGGASQKVRRIALALDASRPALAVAKKIGADMLVVHHPRFWGGLDTLSRDDDAGGRAAALAASGIAVFSAHTNLDMASGGTNDCLAKAAGIDGASEVVKVERRERIVKLAVFVPATHEEMVRRALTAAGAGAIGKYSDCTFRTRGTGTFKPGARARPFIGRRGRVEEVEEFRLETVFAERSREAILEALRCSHPYEEIAYDLYSLLTPGKEYGFGRIGVLPESMSVPALAERLAAATGSKMVQYRAVDKRKISRVAVWAGGGVDAAAIIGMRPDAVVAGEIGYHAVEQFHDNRIAVLTLGHNHSEELVLPEVKKRLGVLLGGIEIHVVTRGVYGLMNLV